MTDGAKAYIQELDKFTYPSKPYRRELTEEEHEIMRDNFIDYSWSSNIDRKGRIMLSGGECEGGKNFVHFEDLKHLLPIPSFVKTGVVGDDMSTMDLLRSLKKPLALIILVVMMYLVYWVITINAETLIH